MLTTAGKKPTGKLALYLEAAAAAPHFRETASLSNLSKFHHLAPIRAAMLSFCTLAKCISLKLKKYLTGKYKKSGKTEHTLTGCTKDAVRIVYVSAFCTF